MARVLLGFLAVLAFTPVLHAEMSLASYTVSSDPVNGVAITVKNEHVSPMTAILIETRQFSGPGKLRALHARYMDVYVNPGYERAIGPGEVRTFALQPPQALLRGTYQVQLAGALFEDGARFGTPDGIRILVGRRERVRSDLAEVAQLIERVKQSGYGANQILEELQASAQRAKHVAAVADVDKAIGTIGGFVAVFAFNSINGAGSACLSNPACTGRRVEAAILHLRNWQTSIPSLPAP